MMGLNALLTDAVFITMAGLVGSCPGTVYTVYIESAVGIEEGGRTVLTAVVGTLLFLLWYLYHLLTP
jgi:AGZA family xanthine/uracil permease-like MFS transporter